jgi:hypothetical protein
MKTVCSRVHIKQMDPKLEHLYKSIVKSTPFTAISHTLSWRDVLLDLKMGEPVYWLAFSEGNLCGILPAFVCRTDMGNILNSLPLVQSTGGVVTSSEATGEERAIIVQRMIEEMLSWCRENDIHLACIIGSAFLGQTNRASLSVEPDFSMERTIRVIDLEQPLNFRSAIRRAIKKANKYSPVIRNAKSMEDAQLVYNLYADSMRRIGVTPLEWIIFESSYRRAFDKRWVRFEWAEVDGKPVAGLISMWHGRIVDYYSPGTTEFGREIQANSWLSHAMMDIAAKSGMKWWNWMASPSKEVYEFKRRWGGIDRFYTIWLWRLGDISRLLELQPEDLKKLFPGYFIVPYDWLSHQ